MGSLIVFMSIYGCMNQFLLVHLCNQENMAIVTLLNFAIFSDARPSLAVPQYKCHSNKVLRAYSQIP